MRNVTPEELTSRLRQGVTLTEVLMSMLIMSIGVVSVAALFPLSIVRSIQASQLTNATLLRYNAEAQLDVDPSLIHDPDGDGNIIEHYRTPAARNFVVDPWGYYVAAGDDGVNMVADADGAPPLQYFGNDSQSSVPYAQRFDGGVFASRLASEPVGSRIALGERIGIGLAGAVDGWTQQFSTDEISDSYPSGSANPQGVVLSSTVDVSTLPMVATGTADLFEVQGSRITIFDDIGSASQTYPLTLYNSSTRTLLWTEDLDDDGLLSVGEDLDFNGGVDVRKLPSRFQDSTTGLPVISRIVVETSKSRHYSWLLTVRKGPDGQASVDVVIFFNRAVDPQNEELYTARFDPASDQVFLKQNNSDGTPREEPFVKKGGFIFDAVNARWYRIEGVTRRPSVLGVLQTWVAGEYDYIIDVEGSIVDSAGEDVIPATGIPNGILDAGEDTNGNGILDLTAMLIPGVVEVYPLGIKSLPEALQ